MADALINHAFVSLIADGPDATKLRPSNWNAALLLTAGNDGEILIRRTASATGAAWEPNPPPDLSAYVPIIRTVNGHALSANISVTVADLSLGNVDNTSDATKNVAAVTLTNKTLTTPTIGSFVNANHSHLNAAGGGTITVAAISDLLSSTITLSNKTFVAPVLGAAVATTLAVGTTPSTTGVIRIPNGSIITARNFANNADVDLISVQGASNKVTLGNSVTPVQLNTWWVTDITTGAFGSLSAGYPLTLGAGNIALYGDAANVLAQRNSTNAQTFNLYNTYTDPNNYERLSIKHAANVITFASEAAGTGTARTFNFNVGASSAVLAVQAFAIIAGQPIYVNSGFYPRNGILDDLNATLLILGGTGGLTAFGGRTSAFPALKRSTTKLQVRLADDSAFTDVESAGLNFTTTIARATNPGTFTPIITFGQSTSGITSRDVNAIGVSIGGSPIVDIAGNGLRVKGVLSFNTNPGTDVDDATMFRDAANVLAQRNGTNAQTKRIYETYTDPANYSRLSISAPAGGPITFASEAAGTGTARNLAFSVNSLSTTGNLVFGNELSGAGAVRIPYVTFRGTSAIDSSGAGILLLSNYGFTDFNRLQFGGITASFPALKRSGTTLAVRLADDSADADVSLRAIVGPFAMRHATGTVGTDEIQITPPKTGVANAAIICGTENLFLGTPVGKGVYLNGSSVGMVATSTFLGLAPSQYIAFSSSGSGVGTPDITLTRDAAGILAQRNGTNAQTKRIYETYTDPANYSRLSISAPAGGPITFASEAAGTGTARNLKFTYGGSSTSAITVSDNATALITLGGKTYISTFFAVQSYGGNTDVPSGALVGSLGSNNFSFFPSIDNVTTGAKIVFGYWNGGGRSAVEIANVASGDGTLLLMKSGGLVALGGTTSSFPALKRSSAELQCRLADDSAYANFRCADITFGTRSAIAAETVTGYITITDAGGVSRKLAVVS